VKQLRLLNGVIFPVSYNDKVGPSPHAIPLTRYRSTANGTSGHCMLSVRKGLARVCLSSFHIILPPTHLCLAHRHGWVIILLRVSGGLQFYKDVLTYGEMAKLGEGRL